MVIRKRRRTVILVRLRVIMVVQIPSSNKFFLLFMPFILLISGALAFDKEWHGWLRG